MKLWDIVLIVAVTMQALAVSYVYSPRWKALIYGMPFPFTFASLALGQQMDVIHILSMGLMALYIQVVRLLYGRLHTPILAAILVAASAYCLAGWGLVQVVPQLEDLFWISAVLLFLLAWLFYFWLPVRSEPGDRTMLPIWLKAPLTAILVALLVFAKGELQGAIAFFPMMGVFVAYEARKSLWTIGRQNSIVIVTMVPMVAAVHLLYESLGLELAMLLSWGVFLLMFALMWKLERRRWLSDRAAAGTDRTLGT